MLVALTWTGDHLEPLDAQDREVLEAAYAPGEIVETNVRKARNVYHHRKFMALFRRAVEMGCGLHGHRFHHVDALRAYVEICIDWCDYYDVGPMRMPVARSIRFDTVDQLLFEKIYNNAVLFMADELEPPCPEITAEADELRAKDIERESLKDAV